MIYGLSEYQGCKVILYDEESKRTIADGKIIKFDRVTYTVTIDRRAFQEEPHEKVSLLIFYGSALHEYKGTIRRTGGPSSVYVIAIYKGREREDRQNVRYQLDTTAFVESTIVAGLPVPMHNPMRVQVLNISAGGCLIQCGGNAFAVGDTFQMNVKLGGRDALMRATVVRIQTMDGDRAQYGCGF